MLKIIMSIMGITFARILEYFGVIELKNALRDINLVQIGTRPELEQRVYTNWLSHNRKVEDLLDYLDRGILVDMCRDHNLDDKGSIEVLKKRIKKDLKKSSPKRKYLTIGGIIGAIIIITTVGANLTNITTFVEDHFSNNSIQQDGIYGDSYKRYSLGFQISRLTPDWSFQDVKTIATNYDITFFNATLLGGVMVSSPSPEGTKVNVLVFDANEPIFSDIDSFTQKQIIDLGYSIQIKSVIPTYYLDKNSAGFNATGTYHGSNIFFKEKIERYNGKVYVIQSVATYQSVIPNENLQDLQKTYETFGYLK
jgi:hypothetical protein